jgi:hypothetical protein
VGLVVHWRFISSSQFCNDAYTDTELSPSSSDGNSDGNAAVTSDELFNVSGCDACARLRDEARSATSTNTSTSTAASDGNENQASHKLYHSCPSCEQIIYNHVSLLETFRYTAEDDYLTSDLAEAPFYKWMFMIIHWQHPSSSSSSL